MTNKKEKQLIKQLRDRTYQLEHDLYSIKEMHDYYKGKAEALIQVVNAAESIHFRGKKDEPGANKTTT